MYKLESDLQQAMTTPNALIFHENEQVIMLVSASTTAALERNLNVIANVATGLSISIGASEIYDANEHHFNSRDLASQAAEGLSPRGRAGHLRYREMGLELLLKGQARQDDLAFVHNILGALVQDPRHRVLRETLLRYVQEGKSVTRSAQALGIHPNTLYQRLQRIEAVTGRSIADVSDVTLLSLACKSTPNI